MRTLILVRHGKSEWGTTAVDIDRPLKESGESDARLVCEEVKRFLPPKFTIWSSVARRASKTALIFADILSYPAQDIFFREELYTFDAAALETCIRSCSDEHRTLMVFGHNEGLTDFVNKFGDIYIDNVPTSGLVTITFDTGSWSDFSTGKTGKVIFPRDLKA
ncbi:MAG: histidine phosphatase family protein [Flavobacterium sp.]|nr:MAG: histidine phosphatase family protein [Flavobacterium sp.]